MHQITTKKHFAQPSETGLNRVTDAQVFDEVTHNKVKKIIKEFPFSLNYIETMYSENVPKMEYEKWSLIKNNKGYPKEFRDLLQYIEDKTVTRNASLLVATFFRVLCVDLERELDVTDLGKSMHSTWEEFELCLVLPQITYRLNLESNNPLSETIDWLNNKANQERIAKVDRLFLCGLSSSKLVNSKSFGLPRLMTVPLVVTNFIRLTQLDLSDNWLHKLPKEIGKLVHLEYFNLSNNKLKELPEEIDNLEKLENFDLSNNKLKELPEEIGNLVKLKRFNLFTNKLKKLPESIGDLERLEELIVSCNKLKKLPDKIEQLCNLKTLSLFGNKLYKLPATLNISDKVDGLQLFDNPLLVIPKTIIESFPNNTFIEEFSSLINKELKVNLDSPELIEEPYCRTPFETLCQFVRINSDVIFSAEFSGKKDLEELVDALEDTEKTSLYLQIHEKGHGNSNDGLRWGNLHLLDNMDLFVSVLSDIYYTELNK